MIKKKFGIFFWLNNLFLIAFMLLVIILCINTLKDFEAFYEENGIEGILFVICIISVASSYFISWFNLNSVLIKNKGYGLVIDKDGIHNMYAVRIILAGFFICSVKLINWEYVKEFEVDENSGKIKVGFDTEDFMNNNIKVNLFGRVCLTLRKNVIPGLMIKSKFSKEEIRQIESYVYLKSIYLKKDIFDLNDKF